MPTLYMLVGLPGSGKSRIRKTLIKEMNALARSGFIYSTDDYIEFLADDYGISYNSLFGKTIDLSTKIANFELDLAITHGLDVIWDQTNLTIKSRAKKLSRFHDYKKICYYMDTPWMTVLERNLRRDKGRQINQKIIESMYGTFQTPTVDEGFDEIKIIKS
jgi:predicted kinase